MECGRRLRAVAARGPSHFQFQITLSWNVERGTWNAVSPLRIITGCISHETSTFTQVPTTLENFREHFYVQGEEVLKTFTGTNTPTGGFIEGARAHDFELIPTVFAEAYPSGPLPRPLLEDLLDHILEGISASHPVDGVLLELHGAMVADGVDDAEGYMLAALREAVGSGVPIVGQLDIHSHITSEMVEQADVLIGRDTYPEVDMAQKGRECADVLARILRDNLHPTMALCQLPMTAVAGNDVTALPPMKEVMDRLQAMKEKSGVVCASLSHGFPFADVADMGMSVFVTTEDDQALAQSCANEYAGWLFSKRHVLWDFPRLKTTDVLQRHRQGPYPVIVADTNDNPGGGSPGDSTGVLQAFMEAELEDACVLYITDPEGVKKCMEAGNGSTLSLEVGGKSPLQGKPVSMTAKVVACSDGSFQYEGPMYEGLGGSLGPSAHIVENGIHVILVSKREQPLDSALARSLGLDTRRMRFIGLKSSGHFRASFGPWAGVIEVVYEPCVHDFTLEHTEFQKLRRPKFPLDEVSDWRP